MSEIGYFTLSYIDEKGELQSLGGWPDDKGEVTGFDKPTIRQYPLA